MCYYDIMFMYTINFITMARTKEPRAIGRRIEFYRKKKSWSIDKVIQKSKDKGYEVSYATYMNIVTGNTRNPSIETLIKISRTIDVTIDDLTKYTLIEPDDYDSSENDEQ